MIVQLFLLALQTIERGPIRYEVSWLLFVLSVGFASMTCAAQGIEDEEEIDVAQVAGAGASTPLGSTSSVVTGAEEVEEQNWAMPPMPWGAHLGLGGSTTRSGSGFSSTTFSKSLSASTSSYIWQPWFIGLGGNFSVTQSDTSDNAGKTTGDSFSGAFSADILSRSRYPATVSVGYGATSSSGQGSTASADYQNFIWAQRYTPIDRKYNADWQYAWNSFGADGKRIESNRLGGTLGVNLATVSPQSLRFNISLSNAKSSEDGTGSSAGQLAGEHSVYLDEYVMSISTNALMSRDEVQTAGQRSAISQLQVGTGMDWIPSDDYPLRINSRARYYGLGMEAQGNSPSSSSGVNTADVGVSATYPYNENWSFQLSSSALATRFEGNNVVLQNNVYTVSSGASWRGDGAIKTYDNWKYVLTYGSSLSAGYIGFEGDAPGQSGSTGVWSSNLGNSFSRNYLIEDHRNPISLSLTQAVGVAEAFGSNASQSLQSNQSLNHAVNANWRPDGDGRSQVSIQIGLADGRSFGDSDSYHQSFAGAVDKQWLLRNYQSLNGSVSLGISRQGVNGSSDRWKGSGRANLAYGHARFADVNGLAYSVNYSVAIRPYEAVISSQTNAKWEFEHQLSQSWSWRFGLLSWKLTNTNSVSPTSDFSSSLWLTVTRDFGGVL